MTRKIEVELNEETAKIFEVFIKQMKQENNPFATETIEELISQFVYSLSDGIRRSGSWERELITMLTGWNGYLDYDENISPDHSNSNDPRSANYKNILPE